VRCQGIVGLVTDAGVRDGPAVRAPASTFSATALHEGTVRNPRLYQPADRDRRHCGPAGDIVSADDDGVVIVPRRIADVIAPVGRARGKEASVMKALKAGGDILELSGMASAGI